MFPLPHKKQTIHTIQESLSNLMWHLLLMCKQWKCISKCVLMEERETYDMGYFQNVMKIVRLFIGEPNDNISIVSICLCILTPTLICHLDPPFLALFLNLATHFTSCLIPNVVGSSTFPLISISTQIVSSTSFFSSNTTWTIPSTSCLTSIAIKSKSISYWSHFVVFPRMIETLAMNLLLDLIYLK